MGNQNGKDSPNPAGSPLDFFHTPPTTPSQAELTAMALSSSAASPDKTQTPSPAGSTTPSTASPIAEWTQRLSAPAEWAVISVDSVTSADSSAVRAEKASVSPSELRYQERDSGLETQSTTEKAGEEMTLVLLSLMEHYRSSLGLTPNTDVTTGAVELLRRLITEREELVEEVDNLRETLRTERLEWHQFQSDLQVAVSVADRLRAESEQALGSLQENHRSVEEQLAQALSRQQETERALDNLRVEHKDVCFKLSELRRNTCRVIDKQTEGQERQLEKTQNISEDTETKDDASQEVGGENGDTDGGTESGDLNLKGKGVAAGYLRSLADLEKKKDDGRGHKDPRRIVMLSERSWSLSRLPLPAGSSGQNEAPINTSTTLPLCKKEEPTKGRRADRILKRQDSWSNFHTGKQDEDQTSDSVKPQDSFSALLRCHGGSRRNSLLRWSQSRTQGYKNIEITNFSSSWEDGLAFCAVYHTYLPNDIPFHSLSLADKRENLDLAFRTGERLGITATLTVDEMLKAGGPDWQRVLGYVESIFRHFEM